MHSELQAFRTCLLLFTLINVAVQAYSGISHKTWQTRKCNNAAIYYSFVYPHVLLSHKFEPTLLNSTKQSTKRQMSGLDGRYSSVVEVTMKHNTTINWKSSLQGTDIFRSRNASIKRLPSDIKPILSCFIQRKTFSRVELRFIKK